MTATSPRDAGYFLPEDAGNALRDLHDQMQLLYLLARPDSHTPLDLVLPRASLAQLLHLLTLQLQQVADQLAWRPG